VGLLISVLLLLAWLLWFLTAQLELRQSSLSARIEAAARVHPVDPQVDGTVIAVHAVLGQMVQQGELIVQLDDAPQRQYREEALRRLDALEEELRAAHQEIRREEEALGSLRQAQDVSRDETARKLEAARGMAAQAAREAEQMSQLHQQAFVPEADDRRARTHAQELRAMAEVARLSGTRLQREYEQEGSRRRAHLEELRRQLARLEGERGQGQAVLSRLEGELERRAIRAPVRGRIGGLSHVRPGSFIAAGERLVEIVPPGPFQILAVFGPLAAGRVRPGQRALMRVDAYPWLQFGTLNAVVTRVASELREGGLSVELEIDPSSERIPLEHGLPGSVEVSVAKSTPAELVLRTLGLFLNPNPSPPLSFNAVSR